MFFLYVDESGSPFRRQQEHFILAGVTVFERKTHWLSKGMEEIAQSFAQYGLGVEELHGYPMWNGRYAWEKIATNARRGAIADALRLIDGAHYRIIASVVRKEAIAPEDPVRATFEQVISRFDRFLARQFQRHNNPQRGLLVCDKSRTEKSIQALATLFKTEGHQWGKLRNMAEVPLFADSKATRLIQLADLVAYALFRKYEKKDDALYKIIEHKFDSAGGVRHGLHERL